VEENKTPQEESNPADERYLIDVREAADLLDISEEELWALVHDHKIPTHNIAGAFLRFKKSDIEAVKIKWRIHRELFPKKQRWFAHRDTVKAAGIAEKLSDFWYFNDFYVICSLLIIVLLYVIINTQ